MDEPVSVNPGRLARAAAIALPILTLWCAFSGWWDAMTRSAGHLMLALPLVFVYYPSGTRRANVWLDRVLVLLSVTSFGWILVSQNRLMWRLVYVDPLTWPDFLLGITAIVLVLEATRRVLGWALIVTTLFFLTYALAGPWMPGALGHQGVKLELLIDHLYLVPEGLFNVLMGIMATYLFTFLILANLLQVAGGARLLMDLATALGGRLVGGPAKVAVIASALMGTVTGSTTANAVTIGSVTIPLMKRMGLPALEAAAIETAASVGGAVMPPVMGAGVFIMSELTGIPLITILLYSVLPAVLYFASVFAYVHVKAAKLGLRPEDQAVLPSWWVSVTSGAHLALPLVVLVWMLAVGYSPFYASSVAVLVLVAASQLRRDTRIGLGPLLHGLELTTRNALLLTVTSAAAAVVMGAITATGLMLKITAITLALSSGSLFLGVTLVSVISLILGMGLPVTMSYILVATLAAPALADLGTPLLTAHLVIFWFAQIATITPPVCTTAFAAASIAGSPPMRTGFEALGAAKGLYLIPFLLVYSSLLSGNVPLMLFDFLAALLAFVLIPSVLSAHFCGPLSPAQRLVLALAVVGFVAASLAPNALGGAPWMGAGLALAVGSYVVQIKKQARRTHDALLETSGIARVDSV